MRFSLQDVKKTIRRRAGCSKGSDLTLSLQFLRPGALQDEIGKLIAYHESLLGAPQRTFVLEDARACIGDYRLANCLLATLSHWYQWRTRDWNETVKTMSANEELQAIASPIALRLALFSFVNEHYQGFLDTVQRTEALRAFSAQLQLSSEQLEFLLVLDSEEEALCERTSPEPPTAAEVAALYNQWAFEAALFNASDVHFLLDCQALSSFQPENELFPLPNTEPGLGAVIKRLCFLARRFGVYYDLSYETDLVSEAAGRPATLDLLLYGPQEVTGAPQQYGLRLARLCRILLGYRQERGQSKALASALLEAEATVHFLQRTYQFSMDAKLLQLLPSPTKGAVAEDEISYTPTTSLFDSSIEQGFAEAFTALATSQGADGWHLEREPEPLLLEKSIFIPDFALSRGRERIYMEILGFWTPAYRERKIQKLQQLKQRKDLILAIPIDAKDAFTSIADSFPIVYYRGQLSASDILQLLRQHYDDFAERVAQIDVPSVRTLVQEQGILPEQQCYGLLHCYRRSELARVATLIENERVRFLPGLGFYTTEESERLRQTCLAFLQTAGSLPLGTFAKHVRELAPVLSKSEDASIEALASLWLGIHMRRDSIFETLVELDEAAPLDAQESAKDECSDTTAVAPDKRATAKKTGSRKASSVRATTPKKRTAAQSTAVQEDLWGDV